MLSRLQAREEHPQGRLIVSQLGLTFEMKRSLFGFILLGLLSCSKPSETFYMPAEWEPHDAVWLGWQDTFLSYHPVAADIIKSLIPHVQVKVAVDSDSLLRVAKGILIEK